jgi:transposase
MIKRFTGTLSVTKILKIFGHTKYPQRRQCIKCKNRKLSRLSDGRFLCLRCHYKFSILTNTYLQRSILAVDSWYELLWWFTYGFTANKTSMEIKLSQQRVHKCFTTIRSAIYDYEQSEMKEFFGEVEVDETYVGPKFKNRRKKNRDYYRKIKAVKRGRGAKTLLQPVFGLYQRDGRVYVEFIKDAEKKTLQDIIRGRIVLESQVYTDTWKSYKGLNKQGYHHQTIDHGKQEYVKEKKGKKIHINGIEGFWGYLKEHLLKHHGVSKDNLIYYVKEQEFRFNNRHLSTEEFVLKLISVLLNFSPRNA